jgi:alkanesulfonate monooxygenase SsuD/methylene tetrahydromethanopterin reductase-like flavin-dependent oxidoreductase (luciferase family)
MKFSLFFEMQIAGPDADSEPQLFHQCVEQAILADQLGYHSIWAVEHHGLFEYSHSSAPEVFLSFVAARTERIRLGHGITLTPQRYSHPIRVAERVATLDILSRGRVSWGSGKSGSLTEQNAFEVNRAELDGEWREALDMIPRMWQEEVFEYVGRYYDIPPIRVVPRPVQKPHPPIFAACTRPQGAEEIGKLGVGVLSFALGHDDMIAAMVASYRNAIAQATPEAYRKNDHFACTPTALCLMDDRKACRYGFRGGSYFNRAMAAYYQAGTRQVGPLGLQCNFLPEEDLTRAMALRGTRDSAGLTLTGDPSFCREMAARYRAAGVDELILIMQLGTVPHDIVMESIRTFGEEVLPHFS